MHAWKLRLKVEILTLCVWCRLHAIDLTTGHEKNGSPSQILSASKNFPGQGVITFDATKQLQRPGLTLAQGTVFAAFGAHCGAAPYNPWIFAFDAYTLQLTNTYAQPPSASGSGPGIWQSGAGVEPTPSTHCIEEQTSDLSN